MKIVAILNNGRPVKAGQGKKGPWEMFDVELDSGDTAQVFGPIKLGLEVETYDHEKYGLQYRVKRLAIEDLKEILDTHTKLLHFLVKRAKDDDPNVPTPTGYSQAKDTADRIRRERPVAPHLEPAEIKTEEEDPEFLAELFPD